MSHYDSYDYASYWRGRDYEHVSEMIALKAMFSSVPKFESILDIGCGYGRLAPSYLGRTKKATLTDPSAKNLSKAKKYISKYLDGKKSADIKYIHSTLETLSKKHKSKFDMVMLVRVMHHIEDADKAAEALTKLTKDGGYVILEFANKLHAKAMLKSLKRGDFTFPLEIHPNDRRSKRNANRGKITFVNHHPDSIKKALKDNGFKIVQMRSVSNIRSKRLKKIFPSKFLVLCEKYLQVPLARLNFGPSIFILARKDGGN